MKLCDISGDTNLTMQKASWQEIRVIIIHIPRRRGQEEDTLLAWPYNPWWPTTRSPLHLLLSAWEQERNPPIKGSQTLKSPIGLSNNDTPMSQQAESERRSPPIGDLRALKCPIGLSKNDTPMSQQVESERWSPQIGDLHTIKRPIGPLMWRWEWRESPPNWEVMHPRKPNWPLTQREREESPPNWEVMHSQTAQLALSCICNSKISAIEKSLAKVKLLLKLTCSWMCISFTSVVTPLQWGYGSDEQYASST